MFRPEPLSEQDIPHQRLLPQPELRWKLHLAQVAQYSARQITQERQNFHAVTNQLKFTVKLFGATIFEVESFGEEKYIKDKLISFNSKTRQNKKDKYVQLKLNENENEYDIKGSSYTGSASLENIIGNWWSHKILQTNSQISPISGSIKEQVVTFIGKEKIELYGKTYDVEHFKLTSKDMSIPKDKRLNFDIWFDKKNALILKVAYSRMGNWEYRVKKFE